MPFQTNLNGPPYGDDYEESKDFAKILFKPGVTVQTRELNQLQTILQKQIERFGDNIFKQGTIVSGCNFTFFPVYQYVKIKDNEVDGTFAVVSNYMSKFVINQTTGLIGSIQSVVDGFESTTSDLKTLYIKYTNAGTNGSVSTFAQNDVLRVYDINRSLWKVIVSDGGSGFSNTDSVVITPRLIVNVASGTFANGDYVTNNLGANLQIIGIDSVTYSERDQQVLTVRPPAAVLANVSSNSINWTIAISDTLTNQDNTVSARCEGVVGGGARARLLTDGVGQVTSLAILARGSQYTLAPTITVKSANNTSGIGTLNLVAQNYVGDVTVASAAGSVGNGYAFSVSDGVVYQRGAFLRVAAQTIVVSKYDTIPSNVSVGFSTVERIIDSNVDQSLLDNVTGAGNATAPGADRLKATPVLTLVDADEGNANAEFFTLVSWSEGQPYKQNQVSSYNTIADKIAQQTKESQGQYVVDSFLLATRSPIDANTEGSHYSTVIDPGTAYINGYRVQTTTNFALDVPKPITTAVSNDEFLSLNYGNYVYINQMGGTFQYNTGDTVEIYDTVKTFLSNTAAVIDQNTTPIGTLIGTANIRSLTYAGGVIGKQDCVYRLYLFNVSMNPGKSFANARSLYYNGTRKGICDIVRDDANNAVIQESSIDRLLFTTGVDSIANANNVKYIYRTLDQTVTFANTGILQKDNSANIDEIFPYTDALTDQQMAHALYVVPVGADIVGTTNVTGTSSVNSTSANAIGTSTTYLSDLDVGDFVYAYANSTVYQIKRVVNIVNNTLLTLDSNCSFANTAAGLVRCFPKNVPIPFGTRSGLSANVNAGQTVLTLSLGMNINTASSTTVSLGYNVQRLNATQATKTANRSKFVRICLANNAGGTSGPWCIGVPDVFRLRGVYVGNSTVSNTGTNSVTSFQVDHNQNPSFLDLSWLYVADKAPVNLTSDQYLLVEFDHFTGSGTGFYTPTSYVGSNTVNRMAVDSLPLSSLTTNINSFEVPQVFDNNGREYDLLQNFDFRPYVSNTVAAGASPAAAPLNPNSTVSFGNTSSSTNEKKFPLPSSQFVYNSEYFLGRTDTLHIHQDGIINVLQGKPDINPMKRYAPATPSDAMKLADLKVPAFPALPMVASTNMTKIMSTRIFNGKFIGSRIMRRTITKAIANSGNIFTTPRAYTMADIGQLDRRLSDIEYEVSLNKLEANTANLNIPSSLDPTLNRFKYGFFADNLSTFMYSDTTNPSYAADIQSDAVVPPLLNWDCLLAGGIGGPDYVDFPIVVQHNASWPDTLGPVCVLQYVTYTINTVANVTYIHVPGVGPGANTTIPVYFSVDWPNPPAFGA